MGVELTYLQGEHDYTYLCRARVLEFFFLKDLLSIREVINIMMACIFSSHVFMFSFEG